MGERVQRVIKRRITDGLPVCHNNSDENKTFRLKSKKHSAMKNSSVEEAVM